jgi:hypothetical protein
MFLISNPVVLQCLVRTRDLCFCMAAGLLTATAAGAQEPEGGKPSVTVTVGQEKPSAVVLKKYHCGGAKRLHVRYQLGTRNVHAFVPLEGKMRELPWDGDYKMQHEVDERFSNGRYEILVQGDFSRISTVRRLARDEGGKSRELFRSCSVQTSAHARTAGSGNKAKSPAPTPLAPTPSPSLVPVVPIPSFLPGAVPSAVPSL